MKYGFAFSLTFLLTIFSIQSFAQNTSIEDYNGDLGIEPSALKVICLSATGDLNPIKNWNLTSIEEIIYRYEKIDYGSFADKSIPQAMFSELWNKKYSKCYCPPDAASEVEGHLDVIVFYKGTGSKYSNFSFLDQLYHAKGVYKANVNRELYVSFPGNVKGTFLDMLYDIGVEDPVSSVQASKNKQDYYKYMIERYRKDYGARRLSELTDE